MVSFVYLAVGKLDGVSVFKIGKTSKPKQRYSTLRLKFTGFIACINDDEALTLEHLLQAKVRFMGGNRLPRKNDWFLYEDKVYEKVLSWFEKEAEALIESLYHLTGLEDFDYQRQRASAIAFSQEPNLRVDAAPPESAKRASERSEQGELAYGLFFIYEYASFCQKSRDNKRPQTEQTSGTCRDFLEIILDAARLALVNAGYGKYLKTTLGQEKQNMGG